MVLKQFILVFSVYILTICYLINLTFEQTTETPKEKEASYNCLAEDRTNKESCKYEKELNYCGYEYEECDNNYCKKEGRSKCELCKLPEVKVVKNEPCNFNEAHYCNSTYTDVNSCNTQSWNVTSNGVCGFKEESCKDDCLKVFPSSCNACQNGAKYFTYGPCKFDFNMASSTASAFKTYFKTPSTSEGLKTVCEMLLTEHEISEDNEVTLKEEQLKKANHKCPDFEWPVIIKEVEYKNLCVACIDGKAGDLELSEIKFKYSSETVITSKDQRSEYYRIISNINSATTPVFPSSSNSISCSNIKTKYECDRLYKGVCAYKEGGCTENCVFNYPNACLACTDKQVTFYTESTCPIQVNTLEGDKETVSNAKFSSSWLIPNVKTHIEANFCKSSDTDSSCVGEYLQPVCGFTSSNAGFNKKLYNNVCSACSDDVSFYINNSCDSIDVNQVVVPCTTTDSGLLCTSKFFNVCGKVKNKSLFCKDSSCEADYDNNCKACSASNVESYIPTTCEKQFKEKDLSEYANAMFINVLFNKYIFSFIFIMFYFIN